MKRFLSLLAFFVAFAASDVLAQEGKDHAKEAPKAKNPFVQEVETFVKDFDEADKRHFSVLMSNYNLTKVVETVQGDIGMATTKCGETNPDLKPKLDERFKDWSDRVAPVMKEAEQNIENMLLAQNYAQPREIKGFFKKIDQQRAEKNKGIEKVPVASKVACEKLDKTMGKTQDKMVKLLKSTLVSLPQAMQEDANKSRATAADKSDDAKAGSQKSEEKASEPVAAPQAQTP